MGIDQHERKRRQKADRTRMVHPIAAIEKRVMCSTAYTTLSFSARATLLLLAYWLKKDGNGHIQVAEQTAAEHGIERKTFRRALRELQAHQLVVMTWRGGKVHGSCSKYALTWLPIKDRAGIRIDGFAHDAWKRFESMPGARNYVQKCPLDSAQNVPLKAISSPKMSPTPGDKKGPNELDTNTRSELRAWMPGYLPRLAAAGLGGRQCFRLPPVVDRIAA